MTAATEWTTPSKNMNLYFTLECRNCVNLFSTPIGLKSLLRLNRQRRRSILKEDTKH